MMLLEWQGHILCDGEALEQRTGLKEHAHLPHEALALALRKAVDVFVKNMHGARGRLLHTDEDVQQRALPAAGAAYDSEHVAGENIETHPVKHGGTIGQRLHQIPYHEQRLGGLRSRRRQIHFGERDRP